MQVPVSQALEQLLGFRVEDKGWGLGPFSRVLLHCPLIVSARLSASAAGRQAGKRGRGVADTPPQQHRFATPPSQAEGSRRPGGSGGRGPGLGWGEGDRIRVCLFQTLLGRKPRRVWTQNMVLLLREPYTVHT